MEKHLALCTFDENDHIITKYFIHDDEIRSVMDFIDNELCRSIPEVHSFLLKIVFSSLDIGKQLFKNEN